MYSSAGEKTNESADKQYLDDMQVLSNFARERNGRTIVQVEVSLQNLKVEFKGMNGALEELDNEITVGMSIADIERVLARFSGIIVATDYMNSNTCRYDYVLVGLKNMKNEIWVRILAALLQGKLPRILRSNANFAKVGHKTKDMIIMLQTKTHE